MRCYKIKSYAKINMLWNDYSDRNDYTDVIKFDMSNVEPTISGPKKPQEKILLSNVKEKTENLVRHLQCSQF